MKSIGKKYRVGKSVLPNPLVVASCPATEDFDRLLQCANAGAGAAILKSCHTTGRTLDDHGTRRFQKSDRGLWGTSTKARELMHPEAECTLLADIKRCSDFIVIPSVAGLSLEKSEWLDTLNLFEPFNPPCVQLDLFYLEEDLSLPVTQHRLRELILCLRQESKLDLLPKLNQEIRPGAAIEVFNQTGIAGWSVLDSVRTHLPRAKSLPLAGFPDITFSTETDSASLFGYWQLPLVCEYIFRLKAGTNLPILAGGGVRNALDIVQLLSLGADAVQVASSIIQNGPDWIKRTIDDLQSYNSDNFEQNAVPSISSRSHAQIDKSLCSSCGCCSKHLMCTAIEMKTEGPIVHSEKCEGCGFCLDLCPSKAITLSIA